MSILFASTRPRQSDRTRTFGIGILPQRDRLPIGPTTDDRAWAASALNAETTAYSTEDGDWQTHEARTVSRLEWFALQTELATERFVDAMNAISDRLEARREPEEAEVAEMGSQVGHVASPADPEPTAYAPMPWAFVKDANHRTSEAWAAKYNAEKAERKAKEAAAAPVLTLADIPQHMIDSIITARPGDRTIRDDVAEDAAKKAARKPRAKSMRQIRRAAEKAAAKGGA